MAEWTGGIANREYRRGARVEADRMDEVRGYIDQQVQAYLADAGRYRLTPTEERCLSVVYTENKKQAEYAAETYRRLTGTAPRG